MTAILVAGDAMVDILTRPSGSVAVGADTFTQTHLAPGGAGANTAAWLAFLGNETHFIAALGDDALGQVITHACRRVGVVDRSVVVPSVTSGTCIVLIDDTGERSMLPDPGANAHLPRVFPSVLPRCTHFHLSGYALAHPGADHLVDVLRAFPGTTSLDLASTTIIEHASAMHHAVDSCDIVFGTREEFEALGASRGSASTDRTSHTPRIQVMKAGALGVTATRANDRWSIAAPDVQVASTTGAGDAFAAGFLNAWLVTPSDVDAALAGGTRCAARALRRVAAWPPGESAEE